MEPPKVFISYSHDSDKHKEWVLKLGCRLRENGVDVILDQWDLGAGDDLTLFMEKGVRDSVRVLVICTDTYVRKANAGEGGVGYERLIVTAQLTQDLGTKKFIPIIRQSSNDEKKPTFLETRFHIDFTDDEKFDEKLKELLHEIHEVPITYKPPLGKNPLLSQTRESEVLSHNLPDIPDKIESIAEAYESAFKLARADDILGWSRLIGRTRSNAFESLVKWRQEELDGQKPESTEQRHEAIDDALDFVAPLISVALVGIESRNEQFNDQKSLLDDLLNIKSREGWKPAGFVPWIEIPDVLGYVYHSLHGGLCVITGQLTLALDLARVKIRKNSNSQFIGSVWEHNELMGWSASLGGNCKVSWKFLANAYERWKLFSDSDLFEDDFEYRASLIAYYLALHIHELAVKIAAGRESSLNQSFFNVPVDFLIEKDDTKQHAISLLLRNSALSELWTCVNVTQDQMKNSWNDWIHRCIDWLSNVYERSRYSFGSIPHKDIFDKL